MKSGILLAGVLLLSGCKPTPRLEERAAAVSQARSRTSLTEGRAYMQSLRVSLIAAYLDNRDAAEITSCEDPCLQLLSSLDRLELESCEIELESDDDYQVVATFTGGLAFRADQDGVRPIEATSQPQPKQV